MKLILSAPGGNTGLTPRSTSSNPRYSTLLSVKLQDLISVEKYQYDEKFRVRLSEDPNDPKSGNPVLYQEVIVPPGTHFPFIVRMVKPSRHDIGAFLYANSVADGLGYGNYSKLRGDATTQWVAIFDGFAYVSAYELLSSDDDLVNAMNIVAENPSGPVNVKNTLKGAELSEYIQKVTSSTEGW